MSLTAKSDFFILSILSEVDKRCYQGMCSNDMCELGMKLRFRCVRREQVCVGG